VSDMSDMSNMKGSRFKIEDRHWSIGLLEGCLSAPNLPGLLSVFSLYANEHASTGAVVVSA